METLLAVDDRRTSRVLSVRRGLVATAQHIGRTVEILFGVASLVVGLAVLAAIPVAQLLSFGYLLESSARVAKSGRLRDGFPGVCRAARVGGVVLSAWACSLPLWLTRSLADSAYWIDPDGPVSHRWRAGLLVIAMLTFAHVALALARGGRVRSFLRPFGNLAWFLRSWRRGGLYRQLRDGLWDFAASLRLWPLFRLGLAGFLGTLLWIGPPAALLAATIRIPLLAIPGVIWLALIVPWLPFLQVRFAVEGRIRAMFSPKDVRERFRRAPWAFAFALSVMLVASLPLYFLKIEKIPRDAAWLPSLVFVAFLFPARILIGWAYARSARAERRRHWLFRIIGRLAIVPVSLLYVLVVVLSQYTSWVGVATFFEQHAFLLPVPFLSD